MSLTYNINTACPSMEPCEMPHDAFMHSELVSLIHIDFYSRDSCIPIYLLNLLFHNALVFFLRIL